MMRVDLIGGEDFLANIEKLTEQQQSAQEDRQEAEQALRAARAADLEAESEAVRRGTAKPKLTEPAAQKRLDSATHKQAVLTKAVTDEREAWRADLHVRDDEIRGNLAAAEDAVQDVLAGLVREAEVALSERDEIRAYRDWLDDTSRKLSTRRVGDDPLATLRKSVGEGPQQMDSLEKRREHEAAVDAWNAFVKRCQATVPADRKVPVLDADSDSGQTVPDVDAAIEREWDRMIEAGETPPLPVSKKWMQKLGTTAKPKGKGTGWSPLRRPVPNAMPPDTESTAARTQDIRRAD
jgi:hypothetical protein